MTKQVFFIFFLVITIASSYSQINQNGIPFITNYTPQEYASNDQNWCLVHDKRGVLYVGNNTCIMEYDGVEWRKIYVSNNSIIRSITSDSSGIVHVGAVGDFGYLSPDPIGSNQYISLLPKIDSGQRNFGDVWKTYVYNNQIYYCTYNKIFRFANGKVDIIPLSNETKFSFLIDSTIYTEHFFVGLKKLINDSLILIQNGEYFADKDVFFMSGYEPNKLIIGTIFNGLTVYNTNTGNFEIDKIPSELNTFLGKSYLYHGAKINDNYFGLATLQNGFVFIDKWGKIINHITPNEGLQDIIVTSIEDNNIKDEPVWLTLNSGLAKIELNSPFMKFTKDQGLEGAVNDIIRFNGVLYVSTDLGIYYLEYNSNKYPQFIPVEGVSDQSWDFLQFIDSSGKKLLVATGIGLFEVKINQAKQITFLNNENNNYYCYKLFQDTISDLIYIGHSKGLFAASYNNTQWKIVNKFSQINDEIRHIEKSNDSIIWLGTTFKGVIKVSDVNSNEYSVHRYGKESGLESLTDISIFLVNQKMYFGTNKGIFTYNQTHNKFDQDSIFGKEYQSGSKSILKVARGNSMFDFFVSRKQSNQYGLEHIVMKQNQQVVVDSVSFKRLPLEQVDAIFNDGANITWFGSSSGLYSYDARFVKDFKKPYYTLIRKVTLNEDSLIFMGTYFNTDGRGKVEISTLQPVSMIYELDYQFNNVTFEFAAPYFEEENNTEYSYLLGGYKDSWSKWKKEPKAVFTNLREGNYAFKVKARNIYGNESSVAIYQFSILAPWYRTVLAYFIYSILFIIVVAIIVKLYTRKLEFEKVRLEGIVQDRTAEIRCQKEDIERKSEILKVQKEEIEVQAIHLGRANKILHEQKEEIFKQKEEITSSIKYAKRIQRAIVPSEEEAQRLLNDYFLLWRPRDIVSGDFWWMGEKNNLIVIAAADCTGHGVPGAFMSMLGVSFLNEIVNQQDNTQSHEILNKLRHKVKLTLGQTGKDGEAKDGMDIALIVIDFEKKIMQYSGAYNPMYLYRNGELIEYKADRNPIGIYIKEKESFTQNVVELQKGDSIYIFSDGYVDQFGGPDQMKYTSKRFKELLRTIQEHSMEKQKEILNITIDDWKGSTEQIDDIIVLGLRIT